VHKDRRKQQGRFRFAKRQLYLERKAYLKALQDALSGVEEARVVLALARQRLEEGR
jgi:hypothetical protein